MFVAFGNDEVNPVCAVSLSSQMAVGFMLLVASVLWVAQTIVGQRSQQLQLNWLCSVVIILLSRVEYKKAGGLQRAKKEMKAAAVDQARKHEDIIEEGVKFGAKEAGFNYYRSNSRIASKTP